MEFGFGFGVGFALGIVVGLHIARVCWPEHDESIWEKRSREKQMVNDALEKERLTSKEEEESQ